MGRHPAAAASSRLKSADFKFSEPSPNCEFRGIVSVNIPLAVSSFPEIEAHRMTKLLVPLHFAIRPIVVRFDR